MPAGALAAHPTALDPAGTWNCLVYARRELGSDRLKLRLIADGRVLQSRGARGPWVRLSGWRKRKGRIRFRDPRTGRNYVGDLSYPTLGGAWAAASLSGGWWCARARTELAARSWTLRRSASDISGVPLVPTVTAAPRYPRRAIREAKEGRAVACFLVDAQGIITEPELIELSDPVFRRTTLEALAHSRYRGWADARLRRPGCRTFIFTLESIR